MQQKLTHHTLLSLDPDTRVRPSGLTATLLTEPLCPVSVVLQSPRHRSHTLPKQGGVGKCIKVMLWE